MQTLSFNTLAQKATSIIKVKGSKFIGISFPCKTQEEFKKELQIIQNEYPDARHFCYAYRLSDDGTSYKFNDDGEPTNSAGKPILGQIDHFKLTNTGIVVIRYFGGTKLGVGGLIKAYREAAKIALISNQIIEKEITSKLKVNFPYSEMNIIMSMIKEYNLKIINQDMYLNCEMTLEFALSNKTEIITHLDQFSNIEKLIID